MPGKSKLDIVALFFLEECKLFHLTWQSGDGLENY